MSKPSQPLDMQKKFSQVYNFPIEDVDEDEDVDVDEDGYEGPPCLRWPT